MTRKQSAIMTGVFHLSALIFLGLGLYFHGKEWSASTGFLHDTLGSHGAVQAFIVMLFVVAAIDAVLPFVIKRLAAK